MRFFIKTVFATLFLALGMNAAASAADHISDQAEGSATIRRRDNGGC